MTANKISKKSLPGLLLRAATLEQYLYRQQALSEAAQYHRSELANRCLENASGAIAEAISNLARANVHGERMLNLAYFYARLAANILNSENTEYLVGEGCYFDLLDTEQDILNEFMTVLADLDTSLDSLAELIEKQKQ